MTGVRKAAPKKNAYALAKPIAVNTVLTDTNKKRWFVGAAIAQGGFGCIYSAKAEGDQKYTHVVKIEPKENGPLFTEIHFYIRVCLQNHIDNWRMTHSLSHLGVPKYLGSGQFTHSNQSTCRFLVMDRFTGDFENLLKASKVSHRDVVKVTLQVMDALEYLHSKDYAHADIKASNLLYLGTIDRVYLVDFGLVSLFRQDGVHYAAKADPKLKHNGTLEFCSRDAHAGLRPSRRGDLEILAFNLVHWLARCRSGASQGHTAGLPWADLIPSNRSDQNVPLRVKEMVAESKQKAMQNPTSLVASSGLDNTKHLLDFLLTISGLSYADTPNYVGLRTSLNKLNLQLSSGTPIKSPNATEARLKAKRMKPVTTTTKATKNASPVPANPVSTPASVKSPLVSLSNGKRKATKRLSPSCSPAPLRLHNDRAVPAHVFPLSPGSSPVASRAVKITSPIRKLPPSSSQRAPSSHSLSDIFSSSDNDTSMKQPTPSRIVQHDPRPLTSTSARSSLRRRSACCQTSPELLALARKEVALRRQKQRIRRERE